MKLHLVYFLVILIGFPVFSKLNTYIAWRTQQEYIAKNLCVNKDKKELKCKGKCQLMKNLKDDPATSDKPMPQVPKEMQVQPYIASELDLLLLNIFETEKLKFLLFYNNLCKPSAYLLSIFVPPDHIA